MTYFLLLLCVPVSAAMVFGGLAISRMFAPHRPGELKNSIYECGELPIGQAWSQFTIGYYLVGLLFLVFDVDVALLYPWALAFRKAGVTGFIEAGVFLAILGIGLLYAWKKGALEWE